MTAARKVLIINGHNDFNESMERIHDVWVEITGFGDTVPRYLMASDGREAAVERAKTEYVYDRIDLDELELRIEAALRGRLISPGAALDHYEQQKMIVLPRGMEIRELPDPSHHAYR